MTADGQPCILVLSRDSRVLGVQTAGTWALRKIDGEWRMVPVPGFVALEFEDAPHRIVLYDPDSDSSKVLWDADDPGASEPPRMVHDTGMLELSMYVRSPIAPGRRMEIAWGS